MKSLIVNVALKIKRKNKTQDKWIQFFDTYFVSGEDYIEANYYWGDSLDRREQMNNYFKLKNNLLKIYKYYENNSEEYEKIVKSGYNKIKKISSEVVYSTIYKIIKKYSKIKN
jgi:hypothetical protein